MLIKLNLQRFTSDYVTWKLNETITYPSTNFNIDFISNNVTYNYIQVSGSNFYYISGYGTEAAVKDLAYKGGSIIDPNMQLIQVDKTSTDYSSFVAWAKANGGQLVKQEIYTLTFDNDKFHTDTGAGHISVNRDVVQSPYTLTENCTIIIDNKSGGTLKINGETITEGATLNLANTNIVVEYTYPSVAFAPYVALATINYTIDTQATFKFKHWYANDDKIGTGTYKFKHFSIIEPTPQVDSISAGTYVIKENPTLNIDVDITFNGKMNSLTTDNTYGEMVAFNNVTIIPSTLGSVPTLEIANIDEGMEGMVLNYTNETWGFIGDDLYIYTTNDTAKLRTITIETDQEVSQEFKNWWDENTNVVSATAHKLTWLSSITVTVNGSSVTSPYTLASGDVIVISRSTSHQSMLISTTDGGAYDTDIIISPLKLSNVDISITDGNTEKSPSALGFTIKYTETSGGGSSGGAIN